jgi:hypothetical protein
MVATYIRAGSTDKDALEEYWELVEPLNDGEHGVEFGAVVCDRLASKGMTARVKSCMVWTYEVPVIEEFGDIYWSFETKWTSPRDLIEDLTVLFPTISFEAWTSNMVNCENCFEEVDRGEDTVCDNCGFDNA